MANNFLPFCPTDTGTNLTPQGDYAIDTDRTSGQKPGVARSALNNKALRQATAVASQFAEFISFVSGSDTLDDGNSSRLLSQIKATLMPIAPVLTNYLSGSGTHLNTFYFFISSGDATAGATYSNSTYTFTVKETIAAGVVLACTGNGVPAVSGTLTKTGGTGDTTLTFYAFRKPKFLQVRMAGGGGGGGAGTASGGNGGDTTFGTTLLVAGGGSAGGSSTAGGAGGTASLGSGPYGTAQAGTPGAGSNFAATSAGAAGGNTPFFSGGGCGLAGSVGTAAVTNSGGGGGGGSGAGNSGSGGGSGGFIDAYIINPDASYTYSVGAAGTAGSGTQNGGAGGSGIINVFECF